VKKLFAFLLVAVMCVSMCVPVFGAVESSFYEDSKLTGLLNGDGCVYVGLPPSGSVYKDEKKYLDSVNSGLPYLVTMSYVNGAGPYVYNIFYGDWELLIYTDTNDEHIAGGNCLRLKDGGTGYRTTMGLLNLNTQTSVVTSPVSYISDSQNSDIYISSDFSVIVGTDSYEPGKKEYAFDTTIPAPKDLYYRQYSTGSLFWKKTWDEITWDGSSVSPYCARISYTYRTASSYAPLSYVTRVLVDIGTNGTNSYSGLPAADGAYTYEWTVDYMDSLLSEGGHGEFTADTDAAVSEVRVQFYYIDAGKYYVGPISVYRRNYNSLGYYTGDTAWSETPTDVNDLGDFLNDSGSWTSQGNEFTEYDRDGNVVGTGTVGDDASFTSPTGTFSLLDLVKNFVSSFTNIPTTLNYFFTGLQNLFSGIGQLPAMLGSMFSFLPADVLSIIALGLGLVVCLRIFGR